MPIHEFDKTDIITGAFIALASLPFLWWRRNKLQNEVTKFKSAFEYSPVPNFLKDDKGCVVAINKAFTDAFGLDAQDLIGIPIQMQQAFWQTSGNQPINFLETDKIAYETDEVVFSVEQLVPPKPERSLLPDPYRSREYYIAKRRFPIISALGNIKYGLIGSAMSLDLLMLYADRARIRHEENLAKSPLITAINTLAADLKERFAKVEDSNFDIASKLNALSQQVHDHEQDINHILESTNADLAITRKARRQEEQFHDFESPS